MQMGEWDGLAPLAAVAALALLAVMPGQPAAMSPAADQAAVLELSAVGDAVPWSDPRTGRSGEIILAGVWRDGTGEWCRDYRLTIDGRTAQTGRQVACRQAGGQWLDRPGLDRPVMAHRSGKPADQMAAVAE